MFSGSYGQTSTIKVIQDTCRASWRGSRWWTVNRMGIRQTGSRRW